MKRHYILMINLFVMLLPMAGQTTLPTSPSPVLDQFRNDISPQVEMMNRYGTYPVDLSNGLVDISIPLYTIKTLNGLTMPLKISFHASGLRSTEREGILGVRWVLEGASFISRIIRGYPDKEALSNSNCSRDFNPKVSNPDYQPDFWDLYGTTDPIDDRAKNTAFINGFYELNYKQGQYLDTEHDIYSYYLPSGKNGKFIWKKNTTETNGDEIWKGYTMPYEPIQVTPYKIVDENGIEYSFDSVFDTDDRNITTRYLSSITSQNKKDKIEISYVSNSELVGVGYESLTINDHALSGHFYKRPGPIFKYTDCIDWFLYDVLFTNRCTPNAVVAKDKQYHYISKIQVTSEGHPICSVELNYNTYQYRKHQYLKEILVKDATDKVVINIQFTMKYNNKEVGFLSNLSFVDNKTLKAKETYKFDYFQWENMPRCSSQDFVMNSDWWGFYSQGGGSMYSGSLTLSLPNGGVETKNISGGDKKARPESAMIGMIKSIQYPTGGITSFEYEGNSCYDEREHKQITLGGLRIRNIVNRLPSGKIESKHYQYGPGISLDYLYPPTGGYLISNIMMVDCYFAYDVIYQSDYLSTTYQSSFPNRYTDLTSNIVSYEKVTEYDSRYENQDLKTVYNYRATNRSRNSRNKYYLSTNDFEFVDEKRGHKILHIDPSDFWLKNHLVSKTYYVGEKKVKEYLYEYNTYYKETIFDLPVYRHRTQFIHIDPIVYPSWSKEKQEIMMIQPIPHETFAYVHQLYTIGAERLVKETENTYYNDGITTSIIKETEYEPTYLFPRNVIITNSDTIQNITKYSYSFDSYNVFFEDMISNNYLVLLNTSYLSNLHINRSLITDYIKKEKSFYPFKTTDTASQISITYHTYSTAGRPMYITKNNGTEKIVYLWSYNQQYPIAEIKNVTYEEVCNALGGESFVTALADKMIPLGTDYTNLRDIRKRLPEAQITTAEYQPLVGVTKIIDPKGITTFYEYDGLGKLTRSYIIHDGRQQTIEQYDYHYTNQ